MLYRCTVNTLPVLHSSWPPSTTGDILTVYIRPSSIVRLAYMPTSVGVVAYQTHTLSLRNLINLPRSLYVLSHHTRTGGPVDRLAEQKNISWYCTLLMSKGCTLGTLRTRQPMHRIPPCWKQDLLVLQLWTAFKYRLHLVLGDPASPW